MGEVTIRLRVELDQWRPYAGVGRGRAVYSESRPALHVYLSQHLLRPGTTAITRVHLHPPRGGGLGDTQAVELTVRGILDDSQVPEAHEAAMLGFKLYAVTFNKHGDVGDKPVGTAGVAISALLPGGKWWNAVAEDRQMRVNLATLNASMRIAGRRYNDPPPVRATLRIQLLDEPRWGRVTSQRPMPMQAAGSGVKGGTVPVATLQMRSLVRGVVRGLDALLKGRYARPTMRAMEVVHTAYYATDVVRRMPASMYVLHWPVASSGPAYLEPLLHQALFEYGMRPERFIHVVDRQFADTQSTNASWEFVRASGVVMRAACLLNQSLPYLADVDNTGKRGRAGLGAMEQYADVRATGAPDCEEAKEATTNILQYEFKERDGPFLDSPLLESARVLLRVYVPTQDLYVVTTPAAVDTATTSATGGAGGTSDEGTPWLAHEAPVLVPRNHILTMLEATPEGARLLQQHNYNIPADELRDIGTMWPWEPSLVSVFGEGTGPMHELQAPSAVLASTGGEEAAARERACDQARKAILNSRAGRALRGLSSPMRPRYRSAAHVGSALEETQGPLNRFKRYTVSTFTAELLRWGVPCTKLGVVQPRAQKYGTSFVRWVLAGRLQKAHALGLLPMDVWEVSDLDFAHTLLDCSEPVVALRPGGAVEVPAELEVATEDSSGPYVEWVFSREQFTPDMVEAFNEVIRSRVGGATGLLFRGVQLTDGPLGTGHGASPNRCCVRVLLDE